MWIPYTANVISREASLRRIKLVTFIKVLDQPRIEALSNRLACLFSRMCMRTMGHTFSRQMSAVLAQNIAVEGVCLQEHDVHSRYTRDIMSFASARTISHVHQRHLWFSNFGGKFTSLQWLHWNWSNVRFHDISLCRKWRGCGSF